MNEQIRELAEQADPENWHSRWYSGINPRVMDPEIKKFAELIIQECVWQVVKDDQVPQNIQTLIGARIKERFGLEA